MAKAMSVVGCDSWSRPYKRAGVKRKERRGEELARAIANWLIATVKLCMLVLVSGGEPTSPPPLSLSAFVATVKCTHYYHKYADDNIEGQDTIREDDRPGLIQRGRL